MGRVVVSCSCIELVRDGFRDDGQLCTMCDPVSGGLQGNVVVVAENPTLATMEARRCKLAVFCCGFVAGNVPNIDLCAAGKGG